MFVQVLPAAAGGHVDVAAERAGIEEVGRASEAGDARIGGAEGQGVRIGRVEDPAPPRDWRLPRASLVGREEDLPRVRSPS